MLIAKFPYIIVLIVDYAGPAELSSIILEAKYVTNFIHYYLLPFVSEYYRIF